MKKLSHKEEKKKFNLGFLDLLEGNPCPGKWRLPAISCNARVFPDYLALNSHPGDFSHTPNTGVCFAEFDNVFDSPHGLFNSIQYNDERRLAKYKNLYRDVATVITPDYSQFAVGPAWKNATNLAQGRIVGLWFQREILKPVIPLVNFPSLDWLPEVLVGLEDCRAVAFNTMCYVRSAGERLILQEAVKMTVDFLRNLEAIVVYDVCKDNSVVEKLFDDAVQKGIRIVVPENALKIRNRMKAQKRRLASAGFLQ